VKNWPYANFLARRSDLSPSILHFDMRYEYGDLQSNCALYYRVAMDYNYNYRLIQSCLFTIPQYQSNEWLVFLVQFYHLIKSLVENHADKSTIIKHNSCHSRNSYHVLRIREKRGEKNEQQQHDRPQHQKAGRVNFGERLKGLVPPLPPF